MILADTCIWIDHFRDADPVLIRFLQRGEIAIHPFVIGELALGSLHQRGLVLGTLKRLPETVVAREHEVLVFIDQNVLSNLGIGYVDVHLLASAKLSQQTSLWTRDKRLHAAAKRLNLAAPIGN